MPHPCRDFGDRVGFLTSDLFFIALILFLKHCVEGRLRDRFVDL
jgi:hypothetical protein